MDDDLRKLAEATVACLGPSDEPSTKHHLARAYLRLLEEREEILLKDRGKTREINVLTAENRALRAAWAAVSKAACCDDLRPEVHGDAIVKYIQETMGRAAQAFRGARDAHAWRAAAEATLRDWQAAEDQGNAWDTQDWMDNFDACRRLAVGAAAGDAIK